MPSPQTVTMLRSIWASAVIPYIDADLQRVYRAMLDAETTDQWRALQGRGKALLGLLKLPEHMAAELTEEEAE